MSNPFQEACFMLAAHRISQLPADEGAEVAFAGRSNAGKSSAINALTGQKGLARTSRTPGRTQQLVCFALPPLRADGRPARLVDLPGYGYAKVPDSVRMHWTHQMDSYLRQRQSLRGVVLMADIRHSLKPFERDMLDFCATVGLPCQLLLTKADKLSRHQALKALAAVRESMDDRGQVQLFSATHTDMGVIQARHAVLAFLNRVSG